MTWPPRPGEMLPRAEKASRVREKLAGYSLNERRQAGAPKARGFKEILGITISDLDYVEVAITRGIAETPIASVRHNPPYGYNCVVEFRLRGRGEKEERLATLRTVWRIAGPGGNPHLATAFLRP